MVSVLIESFVDSVSIWLDEGVDSRPKCPGVCSILGYVQEVFTLVLVGGSSYGVRDRAYIGLTILEY